MENIFGGDCLGPDSGFGESNVFWNGSIEVMTDLLR
jgi:hypothetical protein